MPTGVYKRKPFTKKHREKIGKSIMGENNGNWNGGISGIRRIKIKRHKCFWCGLKRSKKNKSGSNCIVIHHKDKNRRNNKRSNLIVICQKCHARYHMLDIYKNKKRGKFGRWIKK